MRLQPLPFAALTVLALAACDGTTPTDPQPDLALHVTDEGASILSGEISSPSGAGRRVVTAHVVQTPSGVVNGSYRIEFTASGIFFEVTPSCLVTEGNTAWVAGHITSSNSPLIQIGSVSYFWTIDGGKAEPGVAASPDQISTARFNDRLGQDVEFCTLKLLGLPALAGLEGDLRVK